MTVALFTYGSLMFPQVWEKLAANRYEQTCGVAHHYARYPVRDTSYPGLVAQAGACVEGVVYFDVGDADLTALDAFEGDAYQRCDIQVQLADGRNITAQTYLFLNPEDLSGQEWKPERFALQSFLNRHCDESARSR